MTIFAPKDSAASRLALRCMVTSALVLPVVLAGGSAAQASPGARPTHAQQVRAEAARRAHVLAVRKARAEAARRAHVLAVRKARAEAARLAAQAAAQASLLSGGLLPAPDAPAPDTPSTDGPSADAPATDTPAPAAPSPDAPVLQAPVVPTTDDLVPPLDAPPAEAPVVEAPAAPAPPAVPAVDPNAMPTVSSGPWQRVFSEDFTTPVPIGGFLNSEYKNRWMSYDGFGDTSGVGRYEPNKVLSVKDGALDYYLHSENGVPLGAAPVPLVGGKWGGQTYGRFSLRFRADALPGFGNGWLLWSDANNWNDGEIDLPEGDLDGTINGYDHCVGNPSTNCMVANTGVTWTAWHTATIEWLPGRVTFFLDGKQVGTSTNSPTAAMHMVLQTATNGTKPAAETAGHVQIDWVTIDQYRP